MGASPLSLPVRLSLWIASLLSATVLIARAAASALAFTTFADDVRGRRASCANSFYRHNRHQNRH